MDNYFNGKVAVVTGAAGIICSEVAKDLASLGIFVVLADRAVENAERVAEKIRANGGHCVTYACDVTDKIAVDAFAQEVIEKYGRCDFLINGAGGNNAKAQPKITKFDPREIAEDRPEDLVGLYNVDMQAFEGVIKLNTMGTVYPLLAFAKYMAQQGSGSIVNFASMNTYCPLTRNFAYAMSKAAVENFTKSFAAYLAPAGIRVNAVAPGPMIPPPDLPLSKMEKSIQSIPLQKAIAVEDVVSACLFAAGNSSMTGAILYVDGGLSLT